MLDRILNYAERLGKARDALLIVGGLLFGLGYAASAAFTWANHLPPVSYEKIHYFVIGIIPLLLAIGVGLIARWGAFIQRPLDAPDRATRSKLRLRLIIGASMTLAGVGLGVWQGRTKPHWSLILLDFTDRSVLCLSPMARQGAERRRVPLERSLDP